MYVPAALPFFAFLGVGPGAAAAASAVAAVRAFFCGVSAGALLPGLLGGSAAVGFFPLAAASFLPLTRRTCLLAFVYSLRARLMSLYLAPSSAALSLKGAFLAAGSADQALPAARATSSKLGLARPSAWSCSTTFCRFSVSQRE